MGARVAFVQDLFCIFKCIHSLWVPKIYRGQALPYKIYRGQALPNKICFKLTGACCIRKCKCPPYEETLLVNHLLTQIPGATNPIRYEVLKLETIQACEMLVKG